MRTALSVSLEVRFGSSRTTVEDFLNVVIKRKQDYYTFAPIGEGAVDPPVSNGGVMYRRLEIPAIPAELRIRTARRVGGTGDPQLPLKKVVIHEHVLEPLAWGLEGRQLARANICSSCRRPYLTTPRRLYPLLPGPWRTQRAGTDTLSQSHCLDYSGKRARR